MIKLRSLAILFSLLLFTACGSSESSSNIINLSGLNGESKTLSFDELENMQATTGYGGWITSIGTINEPVPYKGVAVTKLLEEVGGLTEGKDIKITATDDYSMNFSYNQIVANDLPVFSALDGKEIEYENTLTIIVAYLKNGQVIDEEHGPLRIAIVSEKADQITDGHWWIKQVSDIAIVEGQKDYSLKLEGPNTMTIDKNTFESGASKGCHQALYTDNEANQWTGIPLWLLVGYMDDENVHEGKAFNRELVEQGYTVIIHSENEKQVELDADKVAQNNNIIVANQKNNVALGDEFFPLRLVGDGLTEEQMLGKIVKISMKFE